MKLDDGTLPSQIITNNAKLFSFYWQTLLNHFHYFQGRQSKWSTSDFRQLVEGDIVSFLFDDNPVSPTWRLGRVIKIESNNITIDYRNVTKSSDNFSKTCIRSPRDCKLILSEKEHAVLSNDYFLHLLQNAVHFQDSNLREGKGPGHEVDAGKPEAGPTHQ